MRKPLGRLAGAVVAGALITVAVMPAAYAGEDSSAPNTTTSTSTETPTSSNTSTTSGSGTSSSASTTTSDSQSKAPSSSATTTSPGTTSGSVSTTSSKPSETSSQSPTTTPEEPPYEDNVGYGIDFGDGHGGLIIACAAGEPTGLTSPDFDVIEGPYQEEQDGRYWDYLVELHDGKTFASGTITASWECGPHGGGASGGGVPVAPVAGSGQAAAWQQSNGGKAQVSFAPSAGVETGFGGTARD